MVAPVPRNIAKLAYRRPLSTSGSTAGWAKARRCSTGFHPNWSVALQAEEALENKSYSKLR